MPTQIHILAHSDLLCPPHFFSELSPFDDLCLCNRRRHWVLIRIRRLQRLLPLITADILSELIFVWLRLQQLAKLGTEKSFSSHDRWPAMTLFPSLHTLRSATLTYDPKFRQFLFLWSKGSSTLCSG